MHFAKDFVDVLSHIDDAQGGLSGLTHVQAPAHTHTNTNTVVTKGNLLPLPGVNVGSLHKLQTC